MINICCKYMKNCHRSNAACKMYEKLIVGVHEIIFFTSTLLIVHRVTDVSPIREYWMDYRRRLVRYFIHCFGE